MTKAEQARQVVWRDKLLQFAAAADRSVSYACRHFGVSRKTFYKWKPRHGPHGQRTSLTVRPLAKRWQRYEKPQPGHRLQIDEVPRANPRHAEAPVSVPILGGAALRCHGQWREAGLIPIENKRTFLDLIADIAEHVKMDPRKIAGPWAEGLCSIDTSSLPFRPAG
jgi:hypothetical protein